VGILARDIQPNTNSQKLTANGQQPTKKGGEEYPPPVFAILL
jgi:hypothetical protein